jgi:hypothetical protein
VRGLRLSLGLSDLVVACHPGPLALIVVVGHGGAMEAVEVLVAAGRVVGRHVVDADRLLGDTHREASSDAVIALLGDNMLLEAGLDRILRYIRRCLSTANFHVPKEGDDRPRVLRSG